MLCNYSIVITPFNVDDLAIHRLGISKGWKICNENCMSEAVLPRHLAPVLTSMQADQTGLSKPPYIVRILRKEVNAVISGVYLPSQLDGNSSRLISFFFTKGRARVHASFLQ